MNSKLTVCFLLIILMSPSLLTITQADIWDPFHSKQEKTQMWKTLWENHANHANTEYFPVGKTYNGTDILMFTAGNPYGGRILWDGELHGNEDKGSELLYLMAQWLLESNDPQATTILQNNYLMFIPQVNIQDTRGNGDTTISSYGVDLNRNFQTGWTKANPNDDIYSGPNPLSEPETRVMRAVFSAYQPTFYVNMHCGAGPYAAYYNNCNITLSQMVRNLTNNIAQEMNITAYRTAHFDSQGYAIGDAAQLGIQSTWLIETVGEATAWKHEQQDYDDLFTIYLPKCKALLIAMSQLTSPPQPTASKIVYLTQEPPQTSVKPQDTVTIYATLTPNTKITQTVTLEYTVKGEKYEREMTNTSDMLWTSTIPQQTQYQTVTYTVKVKDQNGNISTSDETGNTYFYTVLRNTTPTQAPTTPNPTPTPTKTPNTTPQKTPTPTPTKTPNPTTNPTPTQTPNQTNNPTSTPNPTATSQTTPTTEKTPSANNQQENALATLYFTIAAICVVVIVPVVIIKKTQLLKKINHHKQP